MPGRETNHSAISRNSASTILAKIPLNLENSPGREEGRKIRVCRCVVSISMRSHRIVLPKKSPTSEIRHYRPGMTLSDALGNSVEERY
jgi:hypothetical protein